MIEEREIWIERQRRTYYLEINICIRKKTRGKKGERQKRWRQIKRKKRDKDKERKREKRRGRYRQSDYTESHISWRYICIHIKKTRKIRRNTKREERKIEIEKERQKEK